VTSRPKFSFFTRWQHQTQKLWVVLCTCRIKLQFVASVEWWESFLPNVNTVNILFTLLIYTCKLLIL
jgi:hypothetical protein